MPLTEHRAQGSALQSRGQADKLDYAWKVIRDLLDQIRNGHVVIENPDGIIHHFGHTENPVDAVIAVRDWRFYPRILRDHTLGLGESYMDGWWSVEQGRLANALYALSRSELRTVLHRNLSLGARVLLQYLKARPTNVRRSTKNVRHHYDMGNEFFRPMLGPSMAYSCGFLDDRFPVDAPENDLDRMQERKFELVCQKLGLRAGERLIDIGCGWGGLLFHAAKKYGAHATGITLSTEQEEWIKRRIREEGLEDHVRVERKDYREFRGTFDAFASIGMFEHVGNAQYQAFMRATSSLLKPGGRGLLHTIGSLEYWNIDPWIGAYIFPGSHIPTLDRIVTEMQRAKLSVAHYENFGLHYAETLRRWKENVDAHRGEITAADPRYDDRFFRMIDYYLQFCEAGFRNGGMQLFQILFGKGPEWTFPLRFRFEA